MNILTVNLLCSTLVFWVAARLYVLPRLDELKPRTVLLPNLLLHSLPHLGLMFLAPGATYPDMPAPFAYPAAIGDLLAAVLAIAAIPAVATRHEAPDCSSRSSPSWPRWTCLRRSPSRRSMAHRSTWVPRTGVRRSGFRHSS